MRKILILGFTFSILSVSLGFSSNPKTSFNKISLDAKSSYSRIITYHVGDINTSVRPVIIRVSYSGTYVGCSASFSVNGNDFILRDTFDKGQNVHIGDVATMQNGNMVIYKIVANLK